jgi:hypothetical protein
MKLSDLRFKIAARVAALFPADTRMMRLETDLGGFSVWCSSIRIVTGASREQAASLVTGRSEDEIRRFCLS